MNSSPNRIPQPLGWGGCHIILNGTNEQIALENATTTKTKEKNAEQNSNN